MKDDSRILFEVEETLSPVEKFIEDDSPMMFEVEETLSPVERFIALHGIEITEPHEIVNKGVRVQIGWIAGIDNLFCVGRTKNEAAFELAKSLRLSGWTGINWGL